MAIDKPRVYRYYHIGTSNLVLWLIIAKARQRLKCTMSTPQDALPVNLYGSHTTHISETYISATGDIRQQVYNHVLSDLKGHQLPDASSIILLSSEFFIKFHTFLPEQNS